MGHNLGSELSTGLQPTSKAQPVTAGRHHLVLHFPALEDDKLPRQWVYLPADFQIRAGQIED